MPPLSLKLDLHVHTNYSPDSFSPVREVFKAAKLKALNGLAITDHETTSAINEALKFKGDLIFIPGIEISAERSHILALGIMEPIQSKLPIVDTVEKIHKLGGTAIIAHPYTFFNSIDESLLKKSKIDAIEVINSRSIPFRSKIKQSKQLAQNLQKPQTAGSDAHLPQEIGNAYTIVLSQSTEVDDILHAIKQGNTEVHGTPTALILRVKRLLFQFLK